MKTRDRIIHSATELFNDQGERNITTNHIAAHLGISPGNLYYHFRNKEDIIHSIFDQYARHLSESFTPARSNEIKLENLMGYLDAIFYLMWQFRFFYANLHKVADGGWLPLAIGAGLLAIMHTWKSGRSEIQDRVYGSAITELELSSIARSKNIVRVPGSAVHAPNASVARETGRIAGTRFGTRRRHQRPRLGAGPRPAQRQHQAGGQ